MEVKNPNYCHFLCQAAVHLSLGLYLSVGSFSHAHATSTYQVPQWHLHLIIKMSCNLAFNPSAALPECSACFKILVVWAREQSYPEKFWYRLLLSAVA